MSILHIETRAVVTNIVDCLVFARDGARLNVGFGFVSSEFEHLIERFIQTRWIIAESPYAIGRDDISILSFRSRVFASNSLNAAPAAVTMSIRLDGEFIPAEAQESQDAVDKFTHLQRARPNQAEESFALVVELDAIIFEQNMGEPRHGSERGA